MRSTLIEEIKRFGEDEIKLILNRVPLQFINSDIIKVIEPYARPIGVNKIVDQYGI